ncbi:hypothetical protein AB6A40_010989 [Gnathostoma spinigerum]|uniref:Galectin n=1 Tax=Gnathostoma spinigerum TaxID=75299 RepID=A0ABD6EXU9_9BILA
MEPMEHMKPIHRPQLPCRIPLSHQIPSGSKLFITATPKMNAERFAVNFLSPTEHFLHIRVDFEGGMGKGHVVRNSTVNGQWQNEERQVSSFPFKRGITFDMVITLNPAEVLVEVNGAFLLKFVPRINVPLQKVNAIEIRGDLTVQRILFQ